MKYFLSSVLLFVTIALKAQIQNPALLTMVGLGGEGIDKFYYHPTQTYDGGFIVSIGTSSQTSNIGKLCTTPGARSIFKKYDATGSTLEWERCYTTISYSFLFPTPNEEFVIAGTGYSNKRQFRIIKEDKDGVVIWDKEFGGSGEEKISSMIATADGGYILLGQSSSGDGDVGTNYGDYDIWALKVDTGGNVVWSKVFGGSGEDFPYDIVPGPDNGFYIVGATGSGDHDAVGYHGGADAFVVRIDKDGNKIWSKCLGGSGADGYYVAGCSDGSGGVIIANGSNSTDGDRNVGIGDIDIWVLNLSDNGIVKWQGIYGSPSGYECPKGVCKGSNGDIWVGGFTSALGGNVNNFNGNIDAWVFKIDEVGKFVCGEVLGGGDADQIDFLHPLSNGLLLMGGSYYWKPPIGSVFPPIGYGDVDVFLGILAPWTTAITNVIEDEPIAVFPNPATDRVTIRGIEGDILTATDAVGRKIYTARFSENIHQINVSTWPRGMYYLQVIKFTGERITKALSLV